MLRKYTSTVLLISFVALGSSGLMMTFSHSYAIQLKMHPVHQIFGILMCVSGGFHLYLNVRPIKIYLRQKQIFLAGLLLTVIFVLLFAVGLKRPIDPEFTKKIERAMFQMRRR